ATPNGPSAGPRPPSSMRNVATSGKQPRSGRPQLLALFVAGGEGVVERVGLEARALGGGGEGVEAGGDRAQRRVGAGRERGHELGFGGGAARTSAGYTPSSTSASLGSARANKSSVRPPCW